MLNHSKTWQFSLTAQPKACADAFRSVMGASPGFRLRGVKWDLEDDSVTLESGEEITDAIVATYMERAGFAKVNTGLFGERGEAAEARAVGSQISFAYQADGAGRTECCMWLSRSGKTMGLTADAGYMRSYMTSVEKALRRLDAGMSVRRG